MELGLSQALIPDTLIRGDVDRDSEQAGGSARDTGQFAQGELRSLPWLLPVWQKTFLKVMTVWHNRVRPSNFLQYLLLHFIAPDSC